ncbi:MAG: DNA-protecting protein DprA [Acidobacteria bacterium]|nr:DNA-protecting protein DprA [Acidobacteriota bacterium]
MELLERLAALIGIPASERPARIGAARREAAEALARTASLGLTLLARTDGRYPALLSEVVDPPLALWADGDVSLLGRPSVAIVGSRRASTIGLEIARRLAAGLAEAGLVVVSGMALGIDGAAHRAALEAGGPTIAVLGSGADTPYPRQHADLKHAIARHGVVVTEFPPGTRPFASHFPLRNRIISGLSLATVVVEASERSGSLITARGALEQGREVLAVPGNALSGSYRGAHALIKDGAGLVETVEDVLAAIGWAASETSGRKPVSNLLTDGQLSVDMPVGQPMTADELALRTGRPVAEWLAELGVLELEGQVVRTTGGLFVRLDGPATNRKR